MSDKEETNVPHREPALKPEAAKRPHQFIEEDGRLNRQEFENALHRIPKEVIFQIVEDGVVQEGEMVHLFRLMGLTEEEMEVMRQHLHFISHYVLRYAKKNQQMERDQQIGIITGAQAVAIMSELLHKGLIERFYYSRIAGSPERAPLTPSLGPGPDKSRTQG